MLIFKSNSFLRLFLFYGLQQNALFMAYMLLLFKLLLVFIEGIYFGTYMPSIMCGSKLRLMGKLRVFM